MGDVARPAFSVVVPTRDRPEFVRWSVSALVAQTFGDLEIIVSDNATAEPCRDVIERIGDPRVRYVAPEQPLSMAENWRFATGHATGDYVSVITDKTVYMPSALEHAAAAIEHLDPDIVTWWSDGYDPLDETVSITEGFYRPYFDELRSTDYDPRRVLSERLRFAERRGTEGVRYYWGKLTFGVFSRALLERIERTAGHLFFPIAPDYTSMVPALWLADRALDLGRPLQLTFNSNVSNGQRVATFPAHARRFLHETDPTGAVLDRLPIPRLYMSVHNIVAHDYDTSLRRVAGDDAPHVDRANLALRAAEDLEDVQWDDRKEERAQREILDQWCRTAGGIASDQQALTRRIARRHRVRQRVRGAARAMAGRAPKAAAALGRLTGADRVRSVRCDSILDATQQAEARYRALT